MLFDTFDIPFEASTLQLALGLGLGLIFGIAAQVSRFCLRSSLIAKPTERNPALATWITALAVALAATSLLIAAGSIDGLE